MPIHVSVSANGGVASQSHIATYEGLKILEKGGNAFDAAITVSGLLSIVMPNTGGIGGDGFLIATNDCGEIVGYNGSGRSPKEFSIDEYLACKMTRSPLNVTVPGLVDLWEWTSANHGSIELGLLLQKAIILARNGFYAQESLIRSVEETKLELDKYECWGRLFGHLALGSRICFPKLANIYSAVARRGSDAFYRSRVTEEIVDELRHYGAPVTYQDFAEHRGEKVTPIECDYRDYSLYELPPNSQGLSTLQLLKAINTVKLNQLTFGDTRRINEFFELAVRVYEDRDRCIADPDSAEVPVEQLLSPHYLKERMRKKPYSSNQLKTKDTTNFVIGDKYGNIVGFIQSLFHSFGSGLVTHDIPFQNRGAGFAKSLAVSNSPAPGKRPLHTLSILLARHSEHGDYIIGCAGGDLRPQVDSQIFMNLADYAMPLSKAVEAPRYILTSWRKGEPKAVVEDSVWSHELPIWAESVGFQSPKMGKVHAMRRRTDGILEFAADPRGGGVSSVLL